MRWLWQIEHNGAWRWEIGEDTDGAYVALPGPTDTDSAWTQPLEPGEPFTVSRDRRRSRTGRDAAIAALTEHRRASARRTRDNAAMPVVFNDYMNTLMGDPTTAKLLPLIDAAADAGAEVFCIDAGWYDDGGAGGTASASGCRRSPAFPAASLRCSTASASTAWSRACGWSPR